MKYPQIITVKDTLRTNLTYGAFRQGVLHAGFVYRADYELFLKATADKGASAYDDPEDV